MFIAVCMPKKALDCVHASVTTIVRRVKWSGLVHESDGFNVREAVFSC